MRFYDNAKANCITKERETVIIHKANAHLTRSSLKNFFEPSKNQQKINQTIKENYAVSHKSINQIKTGTNDQNSAELSFLVFSTPLVLVEVFFFHFVIKFKNRKLV